MLLRASSGNESKLMFGVLQLLFCELTLLLVDSHLERFRVGGCNDDIL